MKRIIFALLLMLGLYSLPAFAQASITFSWDYGTPLPSGFEMRLSDVAGGPATLTYDCGAAPTKTCIVPNIPTGNKYAKVFAYNIGVPAILKAYSASSNEVPLTVPAIPTAPTNNRTTGGSIAQILFEVPSDQVAVIQLSFDPKR